MPQPKQKKTCPICTTDVASFKQNPTTCASKHKDDKRACEDCWEAHLSKEVEDKPPEVIECLFCEGIIGSTELKRLALKKTLERYEDKLNSTDGFKCQARCTASKLDPEDPKSPVRFQPYDRERKGRVFTCAYCNFATCTDCDVPEHHGETCSEHKARIASSTGHARDEALTAKALQSFAHCPCCTTPYFVGSGDCNFLSCMACKHRFCGGCDAAWVGDGSHYFLGKEAHAPGCHNKERLVPTKYGYLNRWQESAEVEATLSAKKVPAKKRTAEQQNAMGHMRQVKKEIREEKKRKAEEGSEGMGAKVRGMNAAGGKKRRKVDV